MSLSLVLLLSSMGLLLTGLVGIMAKKHLLRIALAFTLASTGVNILLVWTGYLAGRKAPIIDASIEEIATVAVVDPVPQALVLTSIVIGVAVSALLVVVAVLTSRELGTADVRRMRNLKW